MDQLLRQQGDATLELKRCGVDDGFDGWGGGVREDHRVFFFVLPFRPMRRCSHLWPIYLQNWVVLGVNVGKYIIH